MSTGGVPQDDGHRDSDAPSLANTKKDSQVTDLAEEQEANDPVSQTHKLLADVHRTMQTQLFRFMHSTPLCMGTVIHSIPFVNWYKVQLGEGGTAVPCGMLSESSFIPMGVRSTSPIPPNSNVLVWVPPGNTYGWIIGALPEEITEGVVNIPDFLQQGGNTGAKREKAHKSPFKLHREGATKDFGSRRPMDGTSMEFGKIAETGVGMMVDGWQAFMRVNEACGLFLNYWDSYCRLAGIQFDLQTYARQLMIREDEGENLYVDQNIIYPYEAVGLYAKGTDFTQEFPDQPVQYTLPKGKLDLPDGEEDLQTVARAVMYGGYLGQGYQRFLMAPEKTSGKRQYKNQENDYGLFHELIALDGSYTVRSAKSVSIGKRVLIPNPKRMKMAEDQESGDDSRANNYKFSGQHGGTEEHKVGDVEVTGELKHMRRVAGVLDLLAYNYNWKGLHPFHYHKADYKTWQESQLKPFDRATDVLDFGTLGGAEFMKDPTAKQLKVDERYNQVDYFQRESYINWLEDGGIAIGDGYGAEISLSGGQIRLTAPGDITNLPGKRFVAFSWDSIIRAKNSVDISATNKDVRIKAENNMQIVCNNPAKGGILIHSKSTKKSHVYQNLYGEDVASAGVVLLAKQAETAMLAEEIYLRTGGGALNDGRITIDSSKGRKPTVMYGSTHHIFNSKGVNIWHAPIGENPNMVKSHRFSKNFSKIDGTVIIEKFLCVARGGILTEGTIASNKNIIAAKSMMHKPSPFVGFHSGAVDFTEAVQACDDAREQHVIAGEPAFFGLIVQRWYDPPTALGNENLLENIGYSFRDPPGEPRQYKATQYKLPESRWQQYSRTGMGTGGSGWTEKPVTYQGQKTYPFPGKKKWTEEQTFHEYKKHEIFDEGKAMSQNRPGPYEEPKLSDWDTKVPDGTFKLIL